MKVRNLLACTMAVLALAACNKNKNETGAPAANDTVKITQASPPPGGTWADVVKTNTFVTNYQEFAKHSDVRMRYFGVASPTSTTIQISGLAQPEAMVEIEMIAVVEG